MSIIQTRQTRITTGITDNDTFATKGYVDDNIGPADGEITTEDLTAQLGAGGVTVFTLSSTTVDPEKSILFYNGQKQIYGINYTISGTALTWITTSPSFVLGPNDGINGFWIYYEITSPPQDPPTTPMFFVLSDTNVFAQTGDGTFAKIPMQLIELNVGGHYNQTLSEFTAPVHGFYEFTLTAHFLEIAQEHTSIHLGLQYEGTITRRIILDGNASMYYGNPLIGDLIVSARGTIEINPSLPFPDTVYFVGCVEGGPGTTVGFGEFSQATGKLLYQIS